MWTTFSKTISNQCLTGGIFTLFVTDCCPWCCSTVGAITVFVRKSIHKIETWTHYCRTPRVVIFGPIPYKNVGIVVGWHWNFRCRRGMWWNAGSRVLWWWVDFGEESDFEVDGFDGESCFFGEKSSTIKSFRISTINSDWRPCLLRIIRCSTDSGIELSVCCVNV